MKFLLTIFLLAYAFPALADEGMWPFNQFPKDTVAKNHNFDVTPDFLDRLRLGSVRLSTGGSGSFVSSGGLVLTNQHLVAECLRQHNALRDGFYAAANPPSV
jgi:S1-C subfamily serine protease